MSWVLNAVTAPDNYGLRGTYLDSLPTIKRITLDVSNQPIFFQLKVAADGIESLATWEPEETLVLPSSKPISRDYICGIRIRAAVPFAQLNGRAQAVVTVNAIG